MLDFHTHILPGIDDGSQSAEESIEIINCLIKQGIKKIVLTPHFYAYKTGIDEFCEKRDDSLAILKAEIEKTNTDVELYLGTEVLYFDEIWRIKELSQLKIKGTNYIMVEMPFKRWTDSQIDAVIKIQGLGMTPIIAHIDRHVKEQKNMNVFYKLAQNGVIFQVNTDFVDHFFVRRKIIKLFKKKLISLIGTDCHNMQSRRPEYTKAIRYLEKKLTLNELNRFSAMQRFIMKTAEKV